MTTFFGSSSHPSSDTMDPNFKFVNVFTATASGTISTARIYAGGSVGVTAHVRFVVYAASGTTPGALLGYSDEITIAPAAAMTTLTFTFSTPITGIVNGTSYALGTIEDNSYLLGDTTSGTMSFRADTYSDGPTDPFGSRSTTALTGSFEAGVDVTSVDAPFVAAATTVYVPTLAHANEVDAPFIAATGTAYVPTLTHSGQVEAPFVDTTGTVYTPALTGSGTTTLLAPFVAASTVLYTPVVDRFTAPFAAATTVVYTPTLRRVGIGAQPVGVSIGFDDDAGENAPTWERLDA